MPDPHTNDSKTHLAAALHHHIGTLELTVELNLDAPWSTLFGPSGSGKSTILRAVAGLTAPSRGMIQLDRSLVYDTAHSLNLAPHLRPVRFATQAPNLLPHRSALENLRFGAPSAAPALAEAIAALFRLTELLQRRPHELSGGEQQRLNLARATLAAAAIAPSHLLLDEPFTGMDAALRDTLAPALQRWLADRTIRVLSVTHDLGEVFLLQPHVIRIDGGRILAQGSPAQVLAADRDTLLRRLQP